MTSQPDAPPSGDAIRAQFSTPALRRQYQALLQGVADVGGFTLQVASDHALKLDRPAATCQPPAPPPAPASKYAELLHQRRQAVESLLRRPTTHLRAECEGLGGAAVIVTLGNVAARDALYAAFAGLFPADGQRSFRMARDVFGGWPAKFAADFPGVTIQRVLSTGLVLRLPDWSTASTACLLQALRDVAAPASDPLADPQQPDPETESDPDEPQLRLITDVRDSFQRLLSTALIQRSTLNPVVLVHPADPRDRHQIITAFAGLFPVSMQPEHCARLRALGGWPARWLEQMPGLRVKYADARGVQFSCPQGDDLDAEDIMLELLAVATEGRASQPEPELSLNQLRQHRLTAEGLLRAAPRLSASWGRVHVPTASVAEAQQLAQALTALLPPQPTPQHVARLEEMGGWPVRWLDALEGATFTAPGLPVVYVTPRHPRPQAAKVALTFVQAFVDELAQQPPAASTLLDHARTVQRLLSREGVQVLHFPENVLAKLAAPRAAQQMAVAMGALFPSGLKDADRVAHATTLRAMGGWPYRLWRQVPGLRHYECSDNSYTFYAPDAPQTCVLAVVRDLVGGRAQLPAEPQSEPAKSLGSILQAGLQAQAAEREQAPAKLVAAVLARYHETRAADVDPVEFVLRDPDVRAALAVLADGKPAAPGTQPG